MLSKDDYYLDIALAVSSRSPCLRKYYGAIIVKDDRIVSTGYNGPCRGEAHCETCSKIKANKDETEYLTCPAVHAEQNAIINAGREDMVGATLYLAGYQAGFKDRQEANRNFEALEENLKVEPCEICLRLIKNAGINRIITRKGLIYGRDLYGILKKVEE